MDFSQAHQLNMGGGLFPKFFPPSHSPPSGISGYSLHSPHPPATTAHRLHSCHPPATTTCPLHSSIHLHSTSTAHCPSSSRPLKKANRKTSSLCKGWQVKAVSPWKVENQSRRRYMYITPLTVTLLWFVLVFLSYRVQKGGHYFLPLQHWLRATPDYNTWPVPFWSRVIEHTLVVRWCCNQWRSNC